MFADIFEKGGLGREFQEDLKKLNQICWSCGQKYMGQKTIHLAEGNVEIKCCVCPSCWVDYDEIYLEAIIHFRNLGKAFSVIRRTVLWQKAALKGHILN